MHTRVESPASCLPTAVEYLHAGELVAFPTETVYGLGADARRDDAVGKIYAAKGRPNGNPLIVHVANVADAQRYIKQWPSVAARLSAAFWPGPLTMILQRGAELSAKVSAGRSTVAIRCPRHPIAHALLVAFGGPIAAPSANRSGFTSPTTAQHVLAELAGRVPLILDGGPCEVGLESTVIDLSVDVPTILRHGAVTAEMLQVAIGDVCVLETTVATTACAASPGLHDRHYAPRTPAYRFEATAWPDVKRWAEMHGPIGLLTCDDAIFLEAPSETVRMPGDASEFAHLLYAALREIDARQLGAILIEMPPRRDGMWAAVADRLRRATEPFSRSGGTAGG